MRGAHDADDILCVPKSEAAGRSARCYRRWVGCFRSSKGSSQVIPKPGTYLRLILLLFGGIPNSPISQGGAASNADVRCMAGEPEMTEVLRRLR